MPGVCCCDWDEQFAGRERATGAYAQVFPRHCFWMVFLAELLFAINAIRLGLVGLEWLELLDLWDIYFLVCLPVLILSLIAFLFHLVAAGLNNMCVFLFQTYAKFNCLFRQIFSILAPLGVVYCLLFFYSLVPPAEPVNGMIFPLYQRIHESHVLLGIKIISL